MSGITKTPVDYGVEIEHIDKELELLDHRFVELKTQHSMLQNKRRRLMDKRRRVDVAAALECIEEWGLSTDDVLEIINIELTRRRCKSRDC